MKKEKTQITSHTFLGTTASGGYKYEITFNQSLQHTARMNAMCRGLDEYDKKSGFWFLFHSMVSIPLSLTGWKWTKGLYRYSDARF